MENKPDENPVGEQPEQMADISAPKKKSKLIVSIALVVVLVAASAGLAVAFLGSDSSNEFVASAEDEIEENDAISLEEDTFLFDFGTEPNNDGTDIGDFTPASDENIQRFIDEVASDENEFDGEEDGALIEQIEFDEWNEDGEIKAEVIDNFLNGGGE